VSYGRHVEPTWLERTHHSIPVPDLSPSLQGLRIVHLTDIHCGSHITDEFLDEAIELAQAQNPDLIAITGDFVHKGYKHVERAARLVGRLSAPMGVFAVLGNHDFSVRNALGIRRYPALHRAIADALTAQGIRVLRNETLTLEREGAPLNLCGLDDLWSRECDPDRAMQSLSPDVPCVVLAHNPLTVDIMKSHRWDLMLSGHTHGGQVDWPGLGRVVLGRNAKRLAAGLYQIRSSSLYVNRGVGYGFRFRFQVRPEVAVLTLNRA